MSVRTSKTALPFYPDTDGTPLEAGYVYIGEPGLNPETYPITVYWDIEGTTPAAQPIRTIGGQPSRSGSVGSLFIPGNAYSLTVRDKNGALVYSDLTVYQDVVLESSAQITTLSDLLSVTGSDNAHVKLSAGTWVVSDDETIPSTITPEMPRGAVISVASGKTLTMPIPDAGAYQIFSGSGTVIFNTNDKPALPEWWGIDGTADDIQILKAVNAAGTDGTIAIFGDSYSLTGEIGSLLDRQTILMRAGVSITQTTANKRIFYADTKDQVIIFCNGALLYGEGTYSNGWTGMSGHNDRAIELLNCTRSAIVWPVIKNCGNSGISIQGGDGIVIRAPHIEGTHSYSTAISANDNFQVGIYLAQNTTYGVIDNLRIIAPDISGTTQGVVMDRESDVATGGKSRVIRGAVIHDIPGQHGIYIQDGEITVDAIISDTVINGCKFQVSGVGRVIENIDARVVVNGNDSAGGNGNAGLEFSSPTNGEIHGVRGTVVCHDVVRGLAIDGRVKDGQFHVVANDVAQHGVIVSGDDVQDVDVYANVKRAGRYGALVTATNSTVRLRNPVISEPNTDESTYSGILVQSASVVCDIFDPRISDADTNMVNGIFSDTPGASVGIYGSVNISGASAYAIRTATRLRAFPQNECALSATTAQFHDITKLPTRDTAANIASAAADVNTIGKFPYRQVWDVTNTRLMVAQGGGATDNWVSADGVTTVTPS